VCQSSGGKEIDASTDVLREVLERVAASGSDEVLLASRELAGWPADAVAAMKSGGLLRGTRAAASVVCPGCEQQCSMSVHVRSGAGGSPRAFVICDKRSDINRVMVDVELLEQWRVTGDSLADLMADLLDVRRPGGNATPGRWEIGMFKGTKHSSHLVLLGAGKLVLSLAGHSVHLRDVLQLNGDRFAVDRRTLGRLVDQPVAAAGDAESAAARRERLRARVNTEKAKGTKGYLKLVAAEEGISESRLKQLVREEPASINTVPADPVRQRRTISMRKKDVF
jgi:hypothetical protein